MKSIGQMNSAEVAGYVCSHLESRGIGVVLSGGACVAIYASHRYVSMDLDFIDRLHTTRRRLKAVLAEIGFSEKDISSIPIPSSSLSSRLVRLPLATSPLARSWRCSATQAP